MVVVLTNLANTMEVLPAGRVVNTCICIKCVQGRPVLLETSTASATVTPAWRITKHGSSNNNQQYGNRPQSPAAPAKSIFVCPGLLKTSASAGIPGYVDSYLFAEQATLRKRAVETGEVANTVAFLLSPRSSGINAQGLVIDAGMSTNYFDNEIVRDSEK